MNKSINFLVFLHCTVSVILILLASIRSVESNLFASHQQNMSIPFSSVVISIIEMRTGLILFVKLQNFSCNSPLLMSMPRSRCLSENSVTAYCKLLKKVEFNTKTESKLCRVNESTPSIQLLVRSSSHSLVLCQSNNSHDT